MMQATENTVMFFISCMAAFLDRTRPASSMAKPAAIQNTRIPPMIMISEFMMKTISVGTAAGAVASCAQAGRPAIIDTARAEIPANFRRLNISSAFPSQAAGQSALSSVSPVRTRTAPSTSRTKIFPSPILPVVAVARMVSTT